MTKRTMAEIRIRLHQLADEHSLPELSELAEETRRRFGGRRAGPRARHVDDHLSQRLRDYAIAHPNLCYREIGALFRVDGGRVSEAMIGFRGVEPKEEGNAQGE